MSMEDKALLEQTILYDWLVHDTKCSYSLGDIICDCIQRNVASNVAELVLERDERREAECAEMVVRKEAEASLLAYRAVSHRIAMGQDVEAFVAERKAWHAERLQKLQSLKQSTEPVEHTDDNELLAQKMEAQGLPVMAQLTRELDGQIKQSTENGEK